MFSLPFLIMAGALLVLLLFNGLLFARLAFRDRAVKENRDLPVSVVICARNASEDLRELVPLIMDQDHREFQLVVVNDRSDDDTWEVLQWMADTEPRLLPVNIQADEKFSYGKKIALGVGLRSAEHPFVLLTDADCRPVSRDWISCMASGFHDERRIVLGYSPYEEGQGVANVLERFDGVSKAVQYLSFALAGLPYMGVGRNLGYASELFFNTKGSKSHRHLMSGDDDLFINEVARARNTSIVADPRAFMTTRASADLGTWWRRKRRHYTTARYYRPFHQFLLILLPLARSVFWAALAVLLWRGHWEEALIGLLVKVMLYTPVQMMAMHRLGAGPLVRWALPLEWVFLLLDPAIYLSTLLIKPRRWK